MTEKGESTKERTRPQQRDLPLSPKRDRRRRNQPFLTRQPRPEETSPRHRRERTASERKDEEPAKNIEQIGEWKVVPPDPCFGSPLVSLLIARVLKAGKKSLAKRIVYDAMGLIGRRLDSYGSKRCKTAVLARRCLVADGTPKTLQSLHVKRAALLLERSVLNVRPRVKVLEKKRGRTVLYFPRRVGVMESMGFALKWIVDSAAARPGRKISRRLSEEIIAAAGGRGNARKKKRSVYKLATEQRYWFPRRKKRRRWDGSLLRNFRRYKSRWRLFG